MSNSSPSRIVFPYRHQNRLSRRRSGRRLLVQMLALSPTLILAGCLGDAVPAPSGARSLPERPDFIAPVPAPALRVGDNAKLALAKTRAALDQSNARLTDAGAWYDTVRADFGDSRK